MAQEKFNLLAHPGGSPCPKQVQGPVNLVIGPEGGLVPFEVEQLSSLGFQTIDLGPRLLRVDTALGFVLGGLF